MWGVVKGIFYVCLTIILLLAAFLLTLVFFVDPNQHKAEIIEKIQHTTGRTLEIKGKMEWTFFPLLGIKVNGLTLSNPPLFEKADFLSVENADINLAVLPLLKGNIQVGKITLDGLNLHLIKNIAGQVNWQNPSSSHGLSAGSSRSKREVLDPANKSRDDNTKFFKLAMITINEVNLKNSNISYEDQQRNKKISLEQLQLKSSHVTPNILFPVQARFVFKNDQLTTPVNVRIDAQALFNKEKARLQNLDAQMNQYHWQGWLETNFLKQDLAALNGHLDVNAKNIEFHGIDLYYYSDLADAMINKTHPTRQDTHQTPIESIQGTLDIRNGIINSQDLHIQAEKISASGQGTIDLVKQILEYQLSLQRFTSGIESKPRGPAIPLLITGKFSEPKIRPDWTTLAVTEVKSELKEQLEKHKDQIPEKIQQGLQALLGN